MAQNGRVVADPPKAHPSTEQLFQTQWAIYRKVVDENYLFHREAYSCLHDILTSEVARPFSFLDIACGDCSATMRALSGTQVSEVFAIDLSDHALKLAALALAPLGCSVNLQVGDFTEVLRRPHKPIDVAWIGLSLHHLQRPAKRATMEDIRRILAPGGMLLIYENTSPDGEDHETWMRRWHMQRPSWTAYSAHEWNAMEDHVTAADFPETVSHWHELGAAAGYSEVRERYCSPTDLFRLYSFR